ncbi:Uncharacterised protein [Bordetella pertussis]|nr:Uncharacterised protein [Bordetella pertussis]CFN12590.1 Uncharacterised protein [Bordetella pertussis]CFN60963.1 Uncharacterised protein [Bordetella pertussis]CFO37242.1 Uncharacterised protein [Bordetella pertussis]CFO71329.1 Uncharacterised protein [Bordetella pertussis]
MRAATSPGCSPARNKDALRSIMPASRAGSPARQAASRSTMVTSNPRRANTMAQEAPMMPPPITAT